LVLVDTLTDQELQEQLEIQKKYGIIDIVITSKLGMTVLSRILRTKKHCRLCKKDFNVIFDGDSNMEQKLGHVCGQGGQDTGHFEADFRATEEEMDSYFT
jgi:hypothetical protein